MRPRRSSYKAELSSLHKSDCSLLYWTSRGVGVLLRPDSKSRFDENAKYFGNLDVENPRSAISGRRGASFWERLMTGTLFGRRGHFNLKHSHCLIFIESETCFISPIIQAVSFIFMWRQKGNERTVTKHEALRPNTCILGFSFCPSSLPIKRYLETRRTDDLSGIIKYKIVFIRVGMQRRKNNVQLCLILWSPLQSSQWLNFLLHVIAWSLAVAVVLQKPGSLYRQLGHFLWKTWSDLTL